MLGKLVELIMEYDFCAMFFDAVVNEAVCDRDAEHFFKADGLGTKLNFVCGVFFGFTALIFYGDNFSTVVKFYNVTLA